MPFVPDSFSGLTLSGLFSGLGAKRKEKSLHPVAATGKAGLDPLVTEGFDIRQPQHIPLSANPGLGVFDFKTDQTKPGQAVIDHRAITV